MTAPLTPALRWPVALILTVVGLFLLIVMVSYRPEQLNSVGSVGANLGGQAGAWIAHKLIEAWGIAAFYPPLLMIGYAVAMLRARNLDHISYRLTGAVLLLPVLAGLVHMIPSFGLRDHLLMAWDQVGYHGLGGRVGWQLVVPAGTPESATLVNGLVVDHPGGLLYRYLGGAGSAALLALITIGCLALMRLRLWSKTTRVVRAVRDYQSDRRSAVSAPSAKRTDGVITPDPHSPTPKKKLAEAITPAEQPAKEAVAGGSLSFDEPPAAAPAISEAPSRQQSSVDEVTRRIRNRDTTTSLDAKDLVERIRARRRALEGTADESAADEVVLERSAPVPTASKPTTEIPSEPAAQPAAPVARSQPPSNQPPPPPKPKPKPKPKKVARGASGDEEYELPPVDLLDPAAARDDREHDAEVSETSEMIQELFKEFNINVKVVNATRGPVITQYELELLDAGMRVNKVSGFEKDLCLRLGTEGIRIVAPLPNRKTIGIEVPNRIKEAVVMRDLIESMDPDDYILPLVVGRDVLGAPIIGDLARMPHLLIAGATGMGKSVCLNAIISSVLLFRDPNEVKFIMVDPKVVELAPFDGIPHLLTAPITDMSKAHAALEWACKTMDERFFALRMVGVRDIISYNKLGDAEIRKRLAKKDKTPEDLGLETIMPWVVIVVDEFADLMMVNKEVEKSIIRLCAKSRACGIHVILATQRPSADVVTGLIKANMPSRLCFRVADRNNSRVVLDAAGAENLLGRGDMLFLPPGSSSLVRGQGVWVKETELDGIIEHARTQGDPEYDDSIFTTGAAAMAGGGNGGTGGKANDWLTERQFHEAVWYMYQHNRSGADFLRRKLGVGYNKATKYVEWLEDLGFLSAAKGSRPRDFLKSFEDWLDELKAHDLSWEEDDEIYINPNAPGLD